MEYCRLVSSDAMTGMYLTHVLIEVSSMARMIYHHNTCRTIDSTMHGTSAIPDRHRTVLSTPFTTLMLPMNRRPALATEVYAGIRLW